ncbi:MAG: hypothetical protein Q4B67_05765 [Eubacteriales bacterium]|nr:hypothetical protein [Eubacteriales bacterium]
MKEKNVIKNLIMVIAAVAAAIVPLCTLFKEGEYLYWQITKPSFWDMWVEIGIWGAVLIASFMFIKNKRVLLGVAGLLILAVSYLHSMLLPVLLATLWFLIICSFGSFLTGCSVTVITAGILSVFGACRPLSLMVTVGVAAVLFNVFKALTRRTRGNSNGARIGKENDCLKQDLAEVSDKKTSNDRRDCIFREFGNCSAELTGKERQLAVVTFIVVLLSILTQIARSNWSIDFDSLWYGLRSSYILSPNGSIFEDLKLVGVVYTYPKGFEIITLPLSGFASYAYIPVFNMMIFLLSLKETYRLAGHFTDRTGSLIACMITAVIPGIVGMTLTAKADIITWYLQLVILERFFSLTETEEGRTNKLFEIIAAYLLSLSMKPTSIVFSTVICFMMLVFVLVTRTRISGKPAFKYVAELILGAGAFAVVTLRTFLLTGLPFTSVFTGILTKLGFKLKYPYAVSSIPQNYQDESVLIVLIKRIIKMLIYPLGDDMDHVIIAWGTGIMLVLLVIIALGLLMGSLQSEENPSGSPRGVFPTGRTPAVRRADSQEFQSGEENPLRCQGEAFSMGQTSAVRRANVQETQSGEENPLRGPRGVFPTDRTLMVRRAVPAMFVFIPFVIVNLVSLSMLYQVDGNYFMLLYSVIIILGCAFMVRGRLSYAVIGVMTALAFFFMTLTNWASGVEFTPIEVNRGYYDYDAYYRGVLSAEDGRIYDFLEENPEARVMVFADHPDGLHFKCITESFNDCLSPWGNDEITRDSAAFYEYLKAAEFDYIYIDAGYVREWQVAAEILNGIRISEVMSEGENVLATF